MQVLLDKGLAYYDFATAEETKAERELAEREKRAYVSSRRFMAETAEQKAKFEAEGRTAVVRLKMPREGYCEFTDLIRGPMKFAWAEEQDHVIQRSNGTCLYSLASVVDDRDMRITHVIRAEEHLSNTPRQIFIARGLGIEPPQFAHLPFVAEPGSRNKLSKRKIAQYLKNPDFKRVYEHGRRIADRLGLQVSDETFNPVIVDFYEQVGYLPDAIVNYLLLLGWSLDDKTEFFTRDEMFQHFSLERVVKSAASFDPAKLSAFQEHYMRQLPIEQKVAMVLPYLERAGFHPVPKTVEQIVIAADDRIKTAGDILDYVDFFVADEDLTYDDKAFEKRITKPPQAIALLRKFRDRLAQAEAFDAGSLDKLMHQFVEDEGIKIGEIIHAVRVAVTGKAVGFGLFDALAILGQERCLKRIDQALRRAEGR
ncbi:MAG: glutamate--tRNA ligase [Gemmatales bacterium]|nr:MAG: glutamate--tRNA ligase [Gemmatales bacterium]